jgi:glycosyltransferase involved in cell wall biosynthesis
MATKGLLMLSHDVVGEQMAGPGVRYWELAHVLARHVPLTLAVPAGTPPPPSATVHTVAYSLQHPATVGRLAEEHAALFLSGSLLYHFPALGELDRPMAVDLYIPSILENLEIHRARPLDERSAIHAADLGLLNQLLRVGDFFLCASERQRDFWLGALLANNRVNPRSYADDVTLRKLIDVVPFGLPSRPPVHSRTVLKGIHPGIGAEDRVILWGGGIWEWLDPITVIEAVARLASAGQPVRLFFLGVRHPNRTVPEMAQVRLARERSEELGILNSHVFFNDWVPYEERQNYLLEADVGVSLHLDHVETRFAFRTRVLDYIWAGLPMVLAAGDSMSDLVQEHELGILVPPRDVEAMARALEAILSQPDPRRAYGPSFESLRPLLTWDRLAAPLLAFALNPWRAAREAGAAPGQPAATAAPPEPTPPGRLLPKAWHILREEGPGRLATEVRSYLRWLRERPRP